MLRLGTPKPTPSIPPLGARKLDEQNVVRTSFRITHDLKKNMTLELLDYGHGIKGKSQWIAEAVRAMMADPRFTHSNIYHAQILEIASTRNENTADAVGLPYDVWAGAWHARLDAMKYGAGLTPPEYVEVTISDVLHIAILNHLKSPGDSRARSAHDK